MTAEDLAALFARLETDALDRTFEDERFGNFVDTDPVNLSGQPLGPKGTVSFFGNFFTYSHVFSFETTDAALIEKLTAAIRKNQQRPDYLAQQTYEQVEAERAARAKAQRDKKIADEERRARVLLGLEAA